MLNRTIRSTIIVTIQFIVPAILLLFIIAPQLLKHTNHLNQAQAFFTTHQLLFLFAHVTFYIVLFLLWPWLIKLISSSQNNAPDLSQIKTAISARWYLIAIMAFFELLAWWK